MDKTKEVIQYLNSQNKLIVLENIIIFKSFKEALKVFNIQKFTYYKWNKVFNKEGAPWLLRKSPVAYNHPNKIKQEIVDKVIYLRKEFQLGSWRIKWYLERYHDISISESSVSKILKSYGVGKLYKSTVRRALHSKRYYKSTPGHDVEIDVKVLVLKDLDGNTIKRFQYTAVDDATRIRALQIYHNPNHLNAIEFVINVVKKFPFRIYLSLFRMSFCHTE